MMETPNDVYYHKHLMINVGLLLSRGRLFVYCDSDAIVGHTFVESIIDYFEKDPNIVLHMDQVRNNHKRFYPFNYPTIEEVIGDGCVNWQNGKTTGLWDTEDVLHTRNYGACMAARREDLIRIGGADEHLDYLGHICGPYDMTFRLINSGKREIWHPDELLYHVWHPGQDGTRNYLGPHDGRNVSTRALEARSMGRILPYVENPAIQSLRLQGAQIGVEQLATALISEETLQTWSIGNVAKLRPQLWRVLLSCRRRVVAVRLLKTFSTLLIRRARDKTMELSTNATDVSECPIPPNAAVLPGVVCKAILRLPKAYNFLKRTLEFCVSIAHRSRDCFESLVAQGHHEVSFYGTDDAAEILYDVTLDTPLKIKSVYDDCDGKRFHRFKVLPIERYVSSQEPLIITGSAELENKLKRLKTLGVSADRMIVMI
jgi:hypothetical protein